MHDREVPDPSRAALSALMDGDASAADEACRAWRGDAGARGDWHTYHLIGDLLRSDEHACEPVRDALFVARVRERLAGEPVVLAPAPDAAPGVTRVRRRRGWMAPAAVAAGFVAVAGVLVVTRVDAPDAATPRVAAAPGVPSSAPPAEGTAVIRDRELDRYLAAHRQYANTSTVAVPGGVVRSMAVSEPGR